jgi:hypothetical protein
VVVVVEQEELHGVQQLEGQRLMERQQVEQRQDGQRLVEQQQVLEQTQQKREVVSDYALVVLFASPGC